MKKPLIEDKTIPSKKVQKDVFKFKNPVALDEFSSATKPKFSKKVVLPIAVGIAISLIIASAYYKGFVVAATVNGTPISRLNVIQQLEKQGGKSTLDLLITETLIKNEAKKNNVTVSNQEIDEEIKKIEASVKEQGGTLEQALLQQGGTVEMLRENIQTQKQVEKLLADKLQVSDEDVEAYITENKTVIPEDKKEGAKSQIKEQLMQEKMQKEAGAWVESLKSGANIRYFVNY